MKKAEMKTYKEQLLALRARLRGEDGGKRGAMLACIDRRIRRNPRIQ